MLTQNRACLIAQHSAEGASLFRPTALTSFSDGTTPISYQYDATGNRTSQTIGGNTNTYAIASNSNRINSITGGSTTLAYTHDANGSVTNDGTYSYTYDAAGRLTQASQGATVKGSYVLNGFGQRVKKTSAAGAVLFAYDEGGKLIGEYDPAGNVIQETVYLNDMPLAIIKPTGTYYIHADHLNTPRKIYNQQGQLVWHWEIATFGASLPNQNPSGLGVFDFNLRFPGQYFDAETGNHQNYFRDCYDAKTGRYCQSDPIGLAGGLNTYLYVDGNPIQGKDPLGLANSGWQPSSSLTSLRLSPDPFPILNATLQEMLNKNVPGTDQFFHCLATCRATKAGP